MWHSHTFGTRARVSTELNPTRENDRVTLERENEKRSSEKVKGLFSSLREIEPPGKRDDQGEGREGKGIVELVRGAVIIH